MKDELELENQALTAALTLNSAMAVQASAPGGGGGPNQGISTMDTCAHGNSLYWDHASTKDTRLFHSNSLSLRTDS